MIESTLENIVDYYTKIGLSIEDWLLLDPHALMLQGYKLDIPESYVKKHVNTLVDEKRLPWLVPKHRKGYDALPHAKSEDFEEFVEFQKRTGIYPHLIPTSRKELKLLQSVLYELPSGRNIKIIKPMDAIKIFYEKTLGKYDERDVGKDKIEYWKDRIDKIRRAAEEQGDEEVVKFCEDILRK